MICQRCEKDEGPKRSAQLCAECDFEVGEQVERYIKTGQGGPDWSPAACPKLAIRAGARGPCGRPLYGKKGQQRCLAEQEHVIAPPAPTPAPAPIHDPFKTKKGR